MKKRKVFYLKLLPRIPQRSALPEGGEEKEEEDEEEEVSDDVAVGLAWLGKIVYLEQHISSHSSSPGRRRSRSDVAANERRRGTASSIKTSSSSSDPLSFLPDRTTDRAGTALGWDPRVPQQPPELHSYFAEWMMTMRRRTATKAVGAESAQCGLIRGAVASPTSLRPRLRPRQGCPFLANPFEPLRASGAPAG